jgi:Mg-chelatase subunit ChlD
MELANPWMLGWLAAAAIPIALHLLHRRQQQVLPWAAMQLLRQVINQQARRMRIEQWLLLALRTVALLLLATALARPWLARPADAAAVEAGSPPELWVLVLDSSYSMQTREGDVSRWDLAQRRALELVSSLRLGDAVSLLRLASPSHAVILEPAYEQDRVAQEIERLQVLDGGADLASSLDLVEAVLRSVEQSPRLPRTVHVRYLTDLAEATWQAATSGPLRSRLAAVQGQAHSFEIESFSSPAVPNVAVTDLRTSQPFALPSRPLTVTATVHNFGSQPLSRLPVQFQTDGKTVRTEFIDCPPGEARTVVADLDPPRAPFWMLSVELPHDRLTVDDSRTVIVPVRKRLRVACIEDQPGAARMVALSLAPQPLGPLQEGVFQVETVGLFELTAQRLAGWDAVVLCNIAELNPLQVVSLRMFAQRGGAVLHLTGPDTDPRNWNSDDGPGSLAALKLVEVSAEGDYAVDPLGYASPVARPFADYPDAGLLTTPVFRYWRVALDADVAHLIDLGLSNGEPWILRRGLGIGTVVTMLSSPIPDAAVAARGDAWNAIGTWPSFVPLMQQLVQTATGGSGQEHTFTVGEPLRGLLPADSQTVAVRVAGPDGTVSNFSVTGNAGLSEPGVTEPLLWTYDATAQAGIYEVQIGPGVVEPYAVNIAPTQSSLATVAAGELPHAAGRADSAAPGTAVGSLTATGDQDRLARQLLLILLGTLVCESLLAWNMGRRLA